MQSGIKKSPPASLVLPHYAFASISFFVLTILMYFSSESFIGHYFNPKLLTITHITVLGWISMIIFGALYQLLPVLLNTSLYSISIAKLAFVSFILGIPLLGYSFWTFSIGLPLQISAILLLIGATLFLLNIIITSKKAEKYTIEAEFIVTATIWFWLTVIVGVLMVFNFHFVFLPKEHLYYLKLHAHIGIAGWFILLIIGVSSKLIPMFLLSPLLNDRKIKYAYNLVNIGIIGFLIDFLFFKGGDRGIIYFVIVISGILFHVSFLFEAYKKRARKKLDIGMKHSFLAVIIITIPIIFGLLVNSNLLLNSRFSMQVKIVYGISIFLGFISLLILGQTYKTLPFIVWLNKYQNLSGKKGAQLPKDLYSELFVKLQLLFFITGLFILLIGVLFSMIAIIKIACVLLIIAAVIYNLNVFKMLFHKPTSL